MSLVDCGATGEFIDRHYAKSQHFTLVELAQPIPVYNVNGTANKAGLITEVISLILCYKNHSERTTFAVSGLGKQKLILGHSWLQKHNPEMNWITGEVKMSRCPPCCCPGCRDEVCQEHVTQKAESQRKDTCIAGPIPEISHDSNSNSSNKDMSNTSSESPSMEERDHILATDLLLPASSTDIRASSTISQHLAEAFKANSKAESPPIPEYLKEFTSVFSKKSFNALPEIREWDHAIEIIPRSKTSNCKVYPLTPSEQKELDAFLKETWKQDASDLPNPLWHLQFFFIKEKDGSLQLVQDY